MTTNKNSTYSPPILYKAFAVLEEISKHQSELGISDIARRLDISKSTVSGITHALTELGALRQDEQTKKYRLGPTLLQLGSLVLEGVDLRSIAKPLMDELSEKFKETVFMGTFNENRITIIEKSDSPQDLRISAPIGTKIPIFAGATGKVFLAAADGKLLEKILKEKPLPKYTVQSITDLADYQKELQKVRQQGYATDLQEYIEGVNAVSVPLLDTQGSIIAALWMVGFSYSFNNAKVEEAILTAKETAAKIRDRLKG